MAGELNLPGGVSGGNAVYVLINESGQWYNTAGAAFEAFNGANIADYDGALTERGTTGVFSNAGALPTLARGNYGVLGLMRAGASLAQSDFPPFAGQNLKWTGSAEEGVIDVDSDGNADANVAEISGDATAADTLELFAEALDQSTGQIDAGTFGTDAIVGDTVAASAVTKIQAGLALASSFTFTVAGQVDCNVTYVNSVQVTGTGASGDEWGPV